MSHDRDIRVLNGLTVATLDSMKGFEDAAENVKGIAYATMFTDFAEDRGRVAAILQAKVRELHGNLGKAPACWRRPIATSSTPSGRLPVRMTT